MFPLKALAWSLGLFVVLRAPWVEELLVAPLTRMQQSAALFYAGAPSAPILVTTDCSGTDVLALCVAAILAWPVSRRARLAGSALGIALILALNTLRIATLGRAASSPALFETLHLQVWPAILLLATAGYVFAWMVVSMKRKGHSDVLASAAGDIELSSLGRRFAPRAGVFLIAFAFCGPWIARSETLIGAGAWIASTAALLLGTVGVEAGASGSVLSTGRGAFMVTPECLATALIPLYLAAVFTLRLTAPVRALALAAAPPFFAALAIVRLLLLALPPELTASPLFLVHGFHQIVLAVVLVVLAAWWHENGADVNERRVARRAGTALCAAVVLALIAGPALTRGLLGAARAVSVFAPHTLTEISTAGDAQGALALLPAFQAALLLALAMTCVMGWRTFLKALSALFVSQVVFLSMLGEIADRSGVAPHPLVLRAWSVGVPVALTLLALRATRPALDAPATLQMVAHGPA